LKSVLIIEDESSIRNLLRITLEANSYQITEAINSENALSLLNSQNFNLILLDLGLPDIHGQELIKIIRQKNSTPIIVLTVQDEDHDKVTALDNGADDYITKPFSTAELLVRMRVALRHKESAPTNINTNSLKTGPIEMDTQAHIVKVDNIEIKLSVTEYKILHLLLKNKGRVVTHTTLLNEIWGPNSLEHHHYLRVYFANLRKKIKSTSSPQELITTESGVGYRLIDFEAN
jgi:two-component system KDP operon response regulator KdpE